MWLTGLATLWLEGAAPPPRGDRRRGAARGAPHRAFPGSPPLSFHSGWLGGLPDAPPPRVATVTRACLDALSHSHAREALPAVASAVRSGATTIAELVAAVRDIEAHTHYRARVESLVGALAAARAPPRSACRRSHAARRRRRRCDAPRRAPRRGARDLPSRTRSLTTPRGPSWWRPAPTRC